MRPRIPEENLESCYLNENLEKKEKEIVLQFKIQSDKVLLSSHNIVLYSVCKVVGKT